MRFAFIQTHAHTWRITTMCRVLEVSRAGFYAWRVRPRCERRMTDQLLTEQMQTIRKKKQYRSYGSPRMRAELAALGYPAGKHRVARLMREAGLLAITPKSFRVTTNSAHAEPVVANLLARQFDVADHAIDQTWAADITYIPTGESWLYLAVLLDLASRRVVGWALGTRITHELTLSALHMALLHRGARGVVHHSDRGVQYASRTYQQLLASAGCTPSMSRVGNCWDNAVVESFFSTLTKELLGDRPFRTRAQASREIFEFIEVWYNRQRRHSSLGYRSPVDYETQLLRAG